MPGFQPIQDTITFALSAERTVVNDTVRVTVAIEGILPSAQAEKSVNDNIRKILGEFIPEAKWAFGGLTRSRDPSGLERVRLTASTRIAEKLNVQLEQKAERSGRDGISIAAVSTDTAPTLLQMEEAESNLRVEILQKAQIQQGVINKCCGIDYRIHAVSFGPGADFSQRGKISNSGYASLSLDDEAGDSLGNAVKISVKGSITLAITR
jgi:hypothetical protein